MGSYGSVSGILRIRFFMESLPRIFAASGARESGTAMVVRVLHRIAVQNIDK